MTRSERITDLLRRIDKAKGTRDGTLTKLRARLYEEVHRQLKTEVRGKRRVA